jgi:outer membrane protein assembly factor BamA
MTHLIVLCAWLLGAAPQAVTPGEVIADVRVHGNHLTTDDEVIQLSGLKKGAPVTADTIQQATKALKSSGKFDDVQVLKRFASIEDATQIVIMLIVNEGPVRIELPIDEGPGARARLVRRGAASNLMYMPILDAEDGYAPRFGLRVAYVGSARSKTRVSFPFTLGGERRVGAELEKGFTNGRIQFGGALTSSKHPFYEETDRRQRAWARVEGTAKKLHLGGTTSWQRINFGGARDKVLTIGGDVLIDTRLDPMLPRNAVYLLASVEQNRVTPESTSVSRTITRTKVDASGYLGTFGQTVLMARVVREDASTSAPAYFKSLLGGQSNLRGFETASFSGDTLVAGTVELRSPLGSPLNLAKLGIRVFADAGTVYDKGQRYKDQTLKQGYGAGLFLTAAIFHLNLDVAHGKGAGTRVHFGGGISF